MKLSFLWSIVLMTITPVITLAQDYLPIVMENTEWTVLKLTIDTQDPNPPFPRDTSYVRTWIAGDTTIADMDFKKVFSSEFLPGDNIPRYQGAIREVDQVVTWIPRNEILNRLDTLYNFNLAVGDTVEYFQVLEPYYFYVGDIDSVILEDATLRKRIKIFVDFVSTPDIEKTLMYTWIEGLGESQYGLIYPFCVSSNPRCADKLICFKEMQSVLYENFLDACSITTSINLSVNHIKFDVFPNPFSSYVSISSFVPNEAIITIYDLLGKQVFTKKIHSVDRNNLEIDLSHLKKGIYILVFSIEDEKVLKTIIKQ